MRQRWWIGVVALIGVVLAVVLFPRPDTGADIPPIGPAAADPATLGDDRAAAAEAGSPRAGRGKADHGRVLTGPKPGTEAVMAARSRPEIVYSGKIIAPFSAIRYVLLKVGTPEAKAFADELGDGVMADLRAIRTADEPETLWQAAEPRMAEAAAKVKASQWATDDTIVKSLERYELLLQEFKSAKAGAPAGEGETPTPAQPTEPEPAKE